MSVEEKTFKQYCREAKQRLKSGFWEKYRRDLDDKLSKAVQEGVPQSRVRDYYSQKVSVDIKGSKDEFYSRVKEILDREGEVSDAIGRLTDKDYFKTLSYEEKQRYLLELSSNYLECLERYRKEKSINL